MITQSHITKRRTYTYLKISIWMTTDTCAYSTWRKRNSRTVTIPKWLWMGMIPYSGILISRESVNQKTRLNLRLPRIPTRVATISRSGQSLKRTMVVWRPLNIWQGDFSGIRWQWQKMHRAATTMCLLSLQNRRACVIYTTAMPNCIRGMLRVGITEYLT